MEEVDERALPFPPAVRLAVVDEELEQVWAGKKTAKEGLDAIKKRGDEHLERFEKANKG